MATLDMTRKLSMDMARLNKKIEGLVHDVTELSSRVEEIQSLSDRSRTLGLSEVSKRRPKKSKAANAKS